MLSGELAVLQAPTFDGLLFDPFSLLDDGLTPSEVGVGGRHVAQALVVALVIVIFDERLDLAFEVSRQEVVFQQDAVLQGLVPALDLALCHGMIGGAADVLDVPAFEPFSQVGSDVA